MIVGIGTDVVNIGRIERTSERYGKRFLEKLFTKAEQRDILAAAGESFGCPAKMAKIFAAKEAASKALGTGVAAGIAWCDIEISHDKNGRPLLNFYNKALNVLHPEDRPNMIAAELMGAVYWQLLLKLIHSQYNIFATEPVRLTKKEKIIRILLTWLKFKLRIKSPNYGILTSSGKNTSL